MHPLSLDVAKALYLRLTSLYGEKFVKHHPTDTLMQTAWNDWALGLSGITVDQITKAFAYCRMHCSWPPSIAEFREICEKVSGVPSEEECLNLCTKKELNHPVTRAVYAEVGSWAFTHDNANELRKKISRSYKSALTKFRENPVATHIPLDNFKTNLPGYGDTAQNVNASVPKLIDFIEKPTSSVAYGEIMQWDADKVNVNNKNFDKNLYEERMKYLTSLSEDEASLLNAEDRYDRVCHLRELEANREIKTDKPIPEDGSEKMSSPRASNRADRRYKHWAD